MLKWGGAGGWWLPAPGAMQTDSRSAYHSLPAGKRSAATFVLPRPEGVSPHAPVPVRCADYANLHSPNEARLLECWRKHSRAVDAEHPHRRRVELSQPAAAAELELSERTIRNLTRRLRAKESIEVWLVESDAPKRNHHPLVIFVREYADVLERRRKSEQLGRDYEGTPWAVGWWRRPLTQAEIAEPWQIDAHWRRWNESRGGGARQGARAVEAVLPAEPDPLEMELRAMFPDLDASAIEKLRRAGQDRLASLGLAFELNADVEAVAVIRELKRGRGSFGFGYVLAAYPDQLEQAIRRRARSRPRPPPASPA